MAKIGRPSKFNTIDLEKVKFLVLKGFTDKELAEFFEVNIDTWHEWKNAHPEFSDSLKDWKAEYDERVERSLVERAMGYSHPEEKIFCANGEIVRAECVKHYPPDPTSMIFWLKNRQPAKWRDKQEFEHTGKDGGPMQHAMTYFPPEPKTADEWAKQYGEMMGAQALPGPDAKDEEEKK